MGYMGYWEWEGRGDEIHILVRAEIHILVERGIHAKVGKGRY